MPPDAGRPGGAGAGGPALLVGAVVLTPLGGKTAGEQEAGSAARAAPSPRQAGSTGPEMKPPVPAGVHLKGQMGPGTATGLSRARGQGAPQASASPSWWLGLPRRWGRPLAPPTPFSSPPAQHPKLLGAERESCELLHSPQHRWGLPGCRRGPSWAQKRS